MQDTDAYESSGRLPIAKVSDWLVLDWFHIIVKVSWLKYRILSVYITIIIYIYICNKGEKRLSIIVLLDIIPYFPYSANRVKLIYLTPSIIYLLLILNPNTINLFIWTNLENVRDRTSLRNQLRFTTMSSLYSRTVTVLFKWRFTWRIWRSHIRWNLWWEDIFKVPFSYTRVFLANALSQRSKLLVICPEKSSSALGRRIAIAISKSSWTVGALISDCLTVITEEISSIIKVGMVSFTLPIF